MWMIGCLVEAKSEHVAIKAQFILALDCLQSHIFDWCEGVVRHIREELKTFKTWSKREFWYGMLIVSFILERVPVMRSRMIMDIARPREPRKGWWSALMPQNGEDPLWKFFDDAFFKCLNGQILMIEYYPYARMNLTGDPDLRFPPSTQWGPIGKMRNQFHKYFCVFWIFKQFFCYWVKNSFDMKWFSWHRCGTCMICWIHSLCMARNAATWGWSNNRGRDSCRRGRWNTKSARGF